MRGMKKRRKTRFIERRLQKKLIVSIILSILAIGVWIRFLQKNNPLKETIVFLIVLIIINFVVVFKTVKNASIDFEKEFSRRYVDRFFDICEYKEVIPIQNSKYSEKCKYFAVSSLDNKVYIDSEEKIKEDYHSAAIQLDVEEFTKYFKIKK